MNKSIMNFTELQEIQVEELAAKTLYDVNTALTHSSFGFIGYRSILYVTKKLNKVNITKI